MATYTVANGGGNIDAAATYTPNTGLIPGAADVINFTATSGQLTVNTTRTILDINFSNYTNVITFNSVLNVSRNITFGDAGGNATYTVTTNVNGDFRKTGTGNITSNNKVWTGKFTLANGTYTVTFMDKMTVSGAVEVSGTTSNVITLSPNNVFDPERFDVQGNFTVSGTSSTLTGAALIKFTGTANQSVSWTSTGVVRNDIKVDKTGGTLTLSGTIAYNTGTFTYVQGTVNSGSSTLSIATATTTMNTNGSTASGATTTSSTGINWNNVTLFTTLNLTSNFTCVGTLTSGVCTITRAASENVYLGGSLTMSGNITSTAAAIIMNGTGIWSGSSTLIAPLTINTPGTITISGAVFFSTRTLTYTAGTVTTTGSTLTITASCTLATNGITWNNFTTSTTATITLTNNFSMSGVWTSSAGTITFAGAGTFNSTGSISFSGTAAVTTKNALPNITTITISNNATTTLAGDITASGLVTLGITANQTTLSSSGGARTITCSAGLTIGSTNNGFVVCNVNLKITGGTISSSGSLSGGYIQINTTYQFEIDGNVTFSAANALYMYGGVTTGTGGTFKYTSGTVTTTGSSIYVQAMFFNSGSIGWNNVWFISGSASTTVLQSNITVNGLLTLGYLTVGYTINNDGTTKTIAANGGIAMSGSTSIVSGTANIRATGGTITGVSSVQLRNNLEIAGNVTFASGVTFNYNTGILLYTSGAVTTTNSTLSVGASTTLNTNGITWHNLTTSATAVITLSSNFTWSNIWSSTSGTVTFTGAGLLVSTGSISFTAGAAVTIPNSLLSLTTITITSNATTTLVGNISCSGLLTLGITTNSTTLSSSGGARTITTAGGLTTTTTTGFVVCNVNLKITGGTITASGNPAVGGYFQMNTPYQFEIDGNVTFASSGAFYMYGGVASGTGGTFKYTSGTVTTTGSSFYIHSMNVDSGSITWNNIWFLTGGATISVLQSDMTVNGLLTLGYLTVAFAINNNGTAKTITANNGITMSGSTSVVSGTANIVVTGGTITGVSSTQLRNNLTLNSAGTITFASGVTFGYNTGTLTYTAGTIVTTGSTLSVATSTTFATNGMTWNIINWSGGTITLTNALTATGLITASFQLPVLNGSDLYANGGMTFTGINLSTNFAFMSGTSTIRFEGTGAWTSTQQGTYRSNVIINPTSNSFIVNNVYYALGTITYSSSNGGQVTSAVLTLGYHTALSGRSLSRSVTFNTGAMRWEYILCMSYTDSGGGTTSTITCLSNLNVNYFGFTGIGTVAGDTWNFSLSTGANLVNVGNFNVAARATVNLAKDFTTRTLSFSTGVFGRLNNNTVTVTNLLTSQASAVATTWTGTTKLILGDGCSWTRTDNNGPVNFLMEFQGDLTLGSTAFPVMTYSTSPLIYTGRKAAKVLGRLAIGTATMTNMNKVTFQSLTITSGATITMNQFFGGSPDLRSTIVPSSTTNYTISFSDAVEKLARFVKITRATLSRPGQLTVITDEGNMGNNVGIKFAPNQISNGVAKNLPVTDIQLGFTNQGLLKDPTLS